MEVEAKTEFDVKVKPKQPSSSSAARKTGGQKRKASESATRGTQKEGKWSVNQQNVQDDSQENEEIDSLRKLVSEHNDEIRRQKEYVSLLKQIHSVNQEVAEDSRPPSSSATSTATELINLQKEYDSLAMELKELEEEKYELEEVCTTQEELIAARETEIFSLEEQITNQEKRRQKTMADLEKRLGDKIKEPHHSAIYTMGLKLDSTTTQLGSQTTKTADGQARASRQQERASSQQEGAPMLGEHQVASISPRTSLIEGGNLKHGTLLGHGSFGWVYLHLDSPASKPIVVKKVYIGAVNTRNSKLIKSLENEISLMERLNHVRIVQYIRSETWSDLLCIYMEYMSGGSVRDLLKKSGALNEDTTKKYTRQILEGLAYLHEEGIMHRDIKGANVLCDDEQVNVKLADFGLSKQLVALESMSGNSQVGTVHWMAPEVIRGGKYGRRADIWSTGATVVEMLTTQPPWHQLTKFEVTSRIAKSKKAGYVPDLAISREGENFLKCTFRTEKTRPIAEKLLQHRWLKM